MLSSYKVLMYVQRLYRFNNIPLLHLMMVQDQAKSTKAPINYGIFIDQFRPDIITEIRQLERINTKISKHELSIFFNQICINEEIVPNYTYFH